jgi:hypothetical protein
MNSDWRLDAKNSTTAADAAIFRKSIKLKVSQRTKIGKPENHNYNHRIYGMR